MEGSGKGGTGRAAAAPKKLRGWVQPAEERDIKRLEKTGFREADELECQLASGAGAGENCRLALSVVDAEAFTIMCEGRPVGMFGVAPIVSEGWPPGWGMPWFLATDDLLLVKRDFLRQCPIWIKYCQRHYPNLINWVYPENEAGMRWAKFLGFDFVQLELYGIDSTQEFWRVVRTS